MHASQLLPARDIDEAHIAEINPDRFDFAMLQRGAPARLELGDPWRREAAFELQHQPAVYALFSDSQHQPTSFDEIHSEEHADDRRHVTVG